MLLLLWLAVALVTLYPMWMFTRLLYLLLLLLLVLVMLCHFAITQLLKWLLRVCVELFSLLLWLMIITKLRNHLLQMQWKPCCAMTRALWGLCCFLVSADHLGIVPIVFSIVLAGLIAALVISQSCSICNTITVRLTMVQTSQHMNTLQCSISSCT